MWNVKFKPMGIVVMMAAVILSSCDMRRGALVPTPTVRPVPTYTPYPTPTTAALTTSVISAADAEEQLIIDIYARVSPAVVFITSRVIVRDFFWGAIPQEGTGSGFIIDLEGHVVTNNHVVEGAETVLVTLSDETAVEAVIVGTDPDTDVAVLKIDVPAGQLHTAELGTSSNLRVGQRAIAIGNPFGLDRTLTTGVISSLGRPLESENRRTIYDVIQTDAAINPGNSGGPLLDSRGRVIGVNTAIYSPSGGSVGVGFAVPIDTVKRVTQSIIDRGYYPHPWLGITGLTISPELATRLNLEVQRGILITEVVSGQAADQAGLRGGQRRVQIGNYVVRVGGDVIVAIDEIRTPEMSVLVKYLETKTVVGQIVNLTIVRDGREQVIRSTLGEQPRR